MVVLILIVSTLFSGVSLSVFGISIYLSDFLLSLSFGLVILQELQKRQPISSFLRNKFLILTLFGIVSMISLMLSMNFSNIEFGDFFDPMKFIFRNAAFFYLMHTEYSKMDKKRLRLLNFTLVLTLVLSITIDIGFITDIIDPLRAFRFTFVQENRLVSYYVHFKRTPGLLGNSNLSAQMVVFIFMSHYLLNKKLNYKLALLVFLDLLTLGSRTALLSFMILLVYVSVKKASQLERLRVVVLVISIVVSYYIAISFQLASNWLTGYIESVVESGTIIDSSLQARIDFFWRENIRIFLKYPFFGLIMPENQVFLGDGEIFYILRSYGIIGFILFAANVILDLRYAKNSMDPTILLIAILPFMVTNGIFVSVIGIANFYYIVMIYLSGIVEQSYQSEPNRHLPAVHSST